MRPRLAFLVCCFSLSTAAACSSSGGTVIDASADRSLDSVGSSEGGKGAAGAKGAGGTGGAGGAPEGTGGGAGTAAGGNAGSGVASGGNGGSGTAAGGHGGSGGATGTGAHDGGVDAHAALDAACPSANPDPCICGRPDANSLSAAECAEETKCKKAGGVWEPYVVFEAEGGSYGPRCQKADGSVLDAS